MVEVLAKEGLHPPHLIGPEMGHKYHPEVIKDVQSQIEKAVAIGRDTIPKKLMLQTRSLAYSRMHWLEITGMQNQWEDSRAEAVWNEGKNDIRVTTKNVTSLVIKMPKVANVQKVFVDGTEVASNELSGNHSVWTWTGQDIPALGALTKKPLLQGPIDDGFKSRFIVVLPDGISDGSATDKWVRIESDHFLVRWRSLMRGDAIVRKASEVTEQDLKDSHLVVWGTPNTNSLLRKILASKSVSDVVTWNDIVLRVGKQEGPAGSCIPVFCFPNPMSPNRYVVLNSGLTFREAHDKTNSLQNPKLPDWAILDIMQSPSVASSGKVIAADFFDSQWKAFPRVKLPTDRE